MADRSRRDWHPADVVAALRKTPERWTLRRLSFAHQYSANAASEALRKPWPAVERIIADALGCEPWDLWPSRYDRANQPKRGRAAA
jgi:Ner family transcriptional regulator